MKVHGFILGNVNEYDMHQLTIVLIWRIDMVAVGNWDVRARNMVKWCFSQWQKIKHRGLCHQHTKSSHGMYVYCIYIYIYVYTITHTHIERERHTSILQTNTKLRVFFLCSI